MSLKTAIAKKIRAAGGARLVDSVTLRRIVRAPIYKRHLVGIDETADSREIPGVVRQAEGSAPKNSIPGPLLSVVVPAFNVEDYLGTCVDSILKQSYRNLEVIIVDDGSTDSTGTIADRFADKDARVRVLHKRNGGLGAARNSGLDLARGDLITFVDSDDDIPPRAYSLLVDSIMESGSSFSVGSIVRFNKVKQWKPDWVTRVHAEKKAGLTAAEYPEVFWDLFVCNKVFRKDVWDQVVGRFPEGVLYEDQECTAKLYAKGVRFDLLPEVVYRWRLRDDGTSITQNKADVEDLKQRINVARTVLPIVQSSGSSGLLSYWINKLLCEDLFYYYREVPRATPSFWDVLVEGVQEFYLDEQWSLSDWPLGRRLLALAVKRSDYDAFISVLLEQYELGGKTRLNGVWPEMTEWVPSLESFRELVPEALTLCRDENRPTLDSALTGVCLQDDGSIRILGLLAYRGVEPCDDRRVIASLVANTATGVEAHEIELPVECVETVGADGWASHPFVDMKSAGFEAVVSAEVIQAIGDTWCATESPFYELRARLVEAGLEEECRFSETALSFNATTLRAGYLSKEGSRGVIRKVDGCFGLNVMVPRFVATSVDIEHGSLEVTIRLNNQEPARLVSGFTEEELSVRLVLGRKVVCAAILEQCNVCPDSQGSSIWSWKARLDIPGLFDYPLENLTWMGLDVSAASGLVSAVAVDSDFLEDFEKEFAVGVTGFGYLRIAHLYQAATINDYMIDEVRGSITFYGSAHLVESKVRSIMPTFALVGKDRDLHPTSLNYCRKTGKYAVSFDLYTDDVDGRRVAVKTQSYIFEMLTASGKKLPASMWPIRDGHLGDRLPQRFYPPRGRLIVQAVGTCGIGIDIGSAFRWSESGARRQWRLAKNAFGASNRALKEAVLFESFGGRGICDTPLALDSYVSEYRPDLERYWTVRDGSVAVPEGAVPVTLYSQEWYEALSTCRYLVNNNNFPASFRKAENQVYVQTWHGTPLKKIGDHVPSANLSLSYRALMKREATYWDYLIAQSEWAAPVLADAFGYKGKLIVEGYPRNDELLRGEWSVRRRHMVRRFFGIGAEQLVVLYAPTWRDNLKDRNGNYSRTDFLDARLFKKKMADSAVLLQRGHVNTAYAASVRVDGGVIDVGAYPNINDLYLAADVLVTDYSSVMFDFVNTGKPIVYLTPDLKEYRDVTRGFYFDLEAVAPGPIAANASQCLDWIQDYAGLRQGYQGEYERFVSTFAPLDDGSSTSRVGRVLFGN